MTGNRTKIQVSDFGRRINRYIRAQNETRDISGRTLAKLIGRSNKYVQDRISYDKEWAPSDLERICREWGISRTDFFKAVESVDLDSED
ncbi:hypothetical protein DW909_08420 [Bifidobacterium bifidum]|uniref:hypothetical protein n=1 Tax=Bifidobacterium bifidum TaxID=1681 RepID=UPI000E4F0444|nr:hypothetical protein [Bifidobacterium bifidum]RHA93694.1 hypothetical protein DW909_08420 [Bifidobacterium bifidum]